MASIKLTGDTSGAITVSAPAVSGTNTITMPAATGTMALLETAGISWQSVQTSGFTAVAGKGYPCNTTSAAFTVTLPASATAGDSIQIVDYAGTFSKTNYVALGRNGLKINGSTLDRTLTTSREAITITYVDATQGWVSTSASNYGTQSIDPAPPYTVDFLVIAGGGGGASGGGGAGGYRTSAGTSGGGASAESSLGFSETLVYTITVGAGGALGNGSLDGSNGVDSSISGFELTTITSSGGGGGGKVNGAAGGLDGGSGGAGGSHSGGTTPGGSGTASQGYAGGTNGGQLAAPYPNGGGGGAGAVGQNASSSTQSGNGGTGVASTITGGSVTRAGGGGGGAYTSPGVAGAGGSGGGGAGSATTDGANGTVNTGGGGGGSTAADDGGVGGSGVVILSMLDADYTGTTTGSPTVATGVSGKTILTFNASGTYTG